MDMGTVRMPERVGLIAALMALDLEWIDRAKSILVRQLGPIVLQSDPFPFDFSSYYQREMGDHLVKQFISFQGLIAMDQIGEIKRTTNHIEQQLGYVQEGILRRRVNIDPGYVAPSKLVLATTKDYDHRIYLGKGIYAEVTLRYRHGHFQPSEWTYPDYRTELALDFFTRVRSDVLAHPRRHTEDDREM
jgi:hypothetical protein